MNNYKAGLLALAIIGTVNTASAASPSLILRGSAEFGGEELVTVYYRNGDDDKTRAGDGLQFAIGALLKHSPTWESQMTVGYKIGGSTGDNGELDLTSVPFEIMTFHRAPLWRVGAGVNYVTNLELESSGVLDGIDVDFKDAMGFVVEADWFLRNNDDIYFGVRGTVIDYETENTGATVNGNSFGLVFGINY